MQAELPSRYRVIEEVGQGGMAVVYRAVDETLKREVAVKVLHPHLLAEAESKARLEREAQAVAKLQHDNIVQIFDYSGAESRAAYIVTEFIEGQTLKQYFAERTLPFPELAAAIVIEVCGAVAHAHGMGILHRDIKPENVMVRKDGMLKLMDFGVAQVMDLERMTITGQLIGSPAYMAPELIDGRPVDFRTDVFALGIMLFQLATGRLPFSGRNPHEVFKRITDGTYSDPRSINPLIGAHLARIIARALARRPEDRYPTIKPLIEDLRTFVGEAGFEDPRASLKVYFADPQGKTAEIGQQIFDALVENGRAARAAKKTARAIELWNRALALRPNDPAVLVEVRRLQGGQRLRSAALAAGLAAVVAGGSYAAFRMAEKKEMAPKLGGEMAALPAGEAPTTRSPLPEKDLGSPTPAPEGDAKTAGEVTPVPVARSATPAGPSGVRDRAPANGAAEGRLGAGDARVPGATGGKRIFTLGVTPQKADVWVDGQKKFAFDIGHNTLELSWDRDHAVEFKNACCWDERRVVGPGTTAADNKNITVRLRPRPATLTITTNPPHPEANILVEDRDGDWRGNTTPGQDMLVRFDPADDFVKSLMVQVFIGSQPAIQQTAQITAGAKKNLVVNLKP